MSYCGMNSTSGMKRKSGFRRVVQVVTDRAVINSRFRRPRSANVNDPLYFGFSSARKLPALNSDMGV
jgi:hypothetical protein